jgi:hypothetical protein
VDGFAAVAEAAARLATGGLGWTPATFWAATPAELRLALEGRFGGATMPLGAAELARLRERLSDG